ncbi:MAG: septum formation initiator family protein [Zetaproteobacteria bacterium]|nr:septum formation initiator family protein [Zetaproteobacteria bacterium]
MRAFKQPDFVAITLVVSLIGVLLTASNRGKTGIVDYYRLKVSHQNLMQTNTNLQHEIEVLQKQIALLKSSPEYAKHVLKERYNVRAANERVIYFSNQY